MTSRRDYLGRLTIPARDRRRARRLWRTTLGKTAVHQFARAVAKSLREDSYAV
jgi:hypothetical protein